jgi:hypothetical protein
MFTFVSLDNCLRWNHQENIVFSKQLHHVNNDAFYGLRVESIPGKQIFGR